MAVAAAVASGLADCGLGIKSAANALGLDFIPIEQEDYDLVFRLDFYLSPQGQALLAAMRSAPFREAVAKLGGYHTERTGTVKLGPGADTGSRTRARAASVSRQPARRARR